MNNFDGKNMDSLSNMNLNLKIGDEKHTNKKP